MTTNEELVAAVQAGDHDELLKLWEQVRRLVLKQARRWAGVGGLEVDDLMQCGFIALMKATDTYDSDGGSAFSTWLVMHIRREFATACGQRTERQRILIPYQCLFIISFTFIIHSKFTANLRAWLCYSIL